jgi:hypothetical protein
MKDQNEKNPHQKMLDEAKIKNNALAPVAYPATEDIYNKSKLEADIDPNDITIMKAPNNSTAADEPHEKDFKGNMSAEDLDVPGTEMDETEENEGSEDEENNYYSLGGDDHNDLDEN